MTALAFTLLWSPFAFIFFGRAVGDAVVVDLCACARILSAEPFYLFPVLSLICPVVLVGIVPIWNGSVICLSIDSTSYLCGCRAL